MELFDVLFARKNGGSSGGTIRLDAYRDSYGITLSAVVMNLAMYGGGVVTYDSGYEKLWEDILQKQPTHFVLNTGTVATGADATVAINILSADSGVDPYNWFVSGTGVFVMPDFALNIIAALSATEDGKGVIVSVLADPITFPGTEGE